MDNIVILVIFIILLLLGCIFIVVLFRNKFIIDSYKKNLDNESKKVFSLEEENKILNQKLLEIREKLLLSSKELEYQKDKSNFFDSMKIKVQEYQDKISKDFKIWSQEELESTRGKFNENIKQVIENFNSKIEVQNEKEIKKIENYQRSFQEIVQRIAEDCGVIKKSMSISEEFIQIFKPTNIKDRGNWGEWQLSIILDQLDFKESYHYIKEYPVYHDDNRSIRFKLDYLLYFPTGMSLIIECKTPALYERQENKDTRKEREYYLKKMKDIVYNVVKKNYLDILFTDQKIEYKPLPYIMLFISIDRIFNLISLDRDFIMEAYKRKIIIASPTTIISYLSFIRKIWESFSAHTEMEKDMRILQDLSKQFGKIYNKVNDFGGYLGKAVNHYNQFVRILNQDRVEKILKKYDVMRKKKTKAKEEHLYLMEKEDEIVRLNQELLDRR